MSRNRFDIVWGGVGSGGGSAETSSGVWAELSRLDEGCVCVYVNACANVNMHVYICCMCAHVCACMEAFQ